MANCNRCNRLIIARDARIVDADDSSARIEHVCECGAVHSAFIDPDDWIYGLAGEKTPGRICTRCWTRTPNGTLFRCLEVDDYQPCLYGGEPRTWILRVAIKDPRPWGEFRFGMSHLGEQLNALPLYQWRELTVAREGGN